MKAAVTSNSSGYFEPSLTHQLLRGCACGTPHPIALRATNTTICPNCGAPSAPPGTPHTERAMLTGWSPEILIGRLFLAIGEGLAKLVRKD